MNNSVEVNALEQQIAMKIQLTKTLIPNFKKEAKRFLTLLAKYSTQKYIDGIFSKSSNDQNYQDIEQYCDLISKQFCGKIEQIKDKVVKMKGDFSELSKQIKARPQTNAADRIAKFRQRLQQIDYDLVETWKEQNFLALNYRMDVSAKELQRWTAVMSLNKIEQERIKENIENIFK